MHAVAVCVLQQGVRRHFAAIHLPCPLLNHLHHPPCDTLTSRPWLHVDPFEKRHRRCLTTVHVVRSQSSFHETSCPALSIQRQSDERLRAFAQCLCLLEVLRLTHLWPQRVPHATPLCQTFPVRRFDSPI